MPKIRIDRDLPIINGQPLTFQSPADCSDITGLIIYYPEGDITTSKEFAFVDAHGVDVGSGKISLFAENALVKIVLDTVAGKAYVQNADTNNYLETKFSEIEARFKAPLVGTLEGATSVTPSQIAEAVAEGRTVVITHTIDDVECTFSTFNIRGNKVSSEISLVVDISHIDTITLEGSLDTNFWNLGFPGQLATKHDIPEALKNPNALTINGKEYDGSEAVSMNLAKPSDIPTVLPNPNALTINGKEYDGSEPVTVNIEGGSDAAWVATTPTITGGAVQMESALNFTGSTFTLNPHWRPNVGFKYDIYWNGIKYTCAVVEASGEAFVGNRRLLGANYPDTGEPFLFTGWALTNPELVSVQKPTATAETVSLRITTESIVECDKLPEYYLPECVVKSVNGKTPDANGNVSISTGGGGGTSIDVTAEVGQTIVVEEVDGSGKPTKWRAAEYQPRTHWEEIGQGVVLPECVPIFNVEIGGFTYDKELIVYSGEEYVVNWNGTEYTSLCQEVPADGFTAQFIGNLGAMMGEEGTGEPFAIMIVPGDIIEGAGYAAAMIPFDGSESILLSITGKTKVIHELERKYVNDVLLESKRYAEQVAQSKFEGVTIEYSQELVFNETVNENIPGVYSLVAKSRFVTIKFNLDGVAYELKAMPNVSYNDAFSTFDANIIFSNAKGLAAQYMLNVQIAVSDNVNYTLKYFSS